MENNLSQNNPSIKNQTNIKRLVQADSEQLSQTQIKQSNIAQRIQDPEQSTKKLITIQKKILKGLQRQLNKSIKQNTKLGQQAEHYRTEAERLSVQLGKMRKDHELKGQQFKKSNRTIEGLQQTIKELQKMVDVSTSSEEKNRKQLSKLIEKYNIQRDITNTQKKQLQQLRNLSADYFLLKQQITKLNAECSYLKESQSSAPKLKDQNDTLLHENQTLKQNLQQQEKQQNQNKELITKLEKKVTALMEEKKQHEKKVNGLQSQKQEALGQVDTLKLQLDDLKTEVQLQSNKYLNEIKNLKVALHHEHEKLAITEKQLAESVKNAKPKIPENYKHSQLTKENLYCMLEEVEMKVASLKLALEDSVTTIQKRDQQIKKLNQSISQKHNAIMALTREIAKAYPNMDQSEGMEYVEKDIIKMGLEKKDDWAVIVEKVMLENLRLKYSVTQLGEEYNSLVRQAKK